MKHIKLTASEIRSLEHYLYGNPCQAGCVYSEMQNSKKDCKDCKLEKDRGSILEKLNLI